MTAAHEYWVVKRGRRYLVRRSGYYVGESSFWCGSPGEAGHFTNRASAWEDARKLDELNGDIPRVVRVRVKKVRRPIEVGDCVRVAGDLGIVKSFGNVGGVPSCRVASLNLYEGSWWTLESCTLVARGKRGGK